MIRMMLAVDESARSLQAADVFLPHIDGCRKKPDAHLLKCKRRYRATSRVFSVRR